MKNSKEKLNKLTVGLLIAVLFIAAFNSYQLSKLEGTRGAIGVAVVVSDIVPTGIPEIYGEELQLSYDDVSAYDQNKANLAIRKLGQFDRDIVLSGKDKERYINILYKKENGLSCEYCCGARAIIFANGEMACGCAHSFAMRGLAKYLITEHGDEYTDDEILEEVGKWKALFFPSQMQAKAQVLKSKGIELNYINLASNKYRGIEKGSGSGMVGGC